MPEIELWKIFTSLGVPGVALGLFYMLFRHFKWDLPKVPRPWVGPLAILFMLLSFVVVFYALTLWGPKSSVGINLQFSNGKASPNINNVKGNVDNRLQNESKNMSADDTK